MPSLVFRKKDLYGAEQAGCVDYKILHQNCMFTFFFGGGGKTFLTFNILQVYFTSLFGGRGGGYTAHTIHFTKMDFVRLNLSPPRT